MSNNLHNPFKRAVEYAEENFSLADMVLFASYLFYLQTRKNLGLGDEIDYLDQNAYSKVRNIGNAYDSIGTAIYNKTKRDLFYSIGQIEDAIEDIKGRLDECEELDDTDEVFRDLLIMMHRVSKGLNDKTANDLAIEEDESYGPIDPGAALFPRETLLMAIYGMDVFYNKLWDVMGAFIDHNDAAAFDKYDAFVKQFNEDDQDFDDIPQEEIIEQLKIAQGAAAALCHVINRNLVHLKEHQKTVFEGMIHALTAIGNMCAAFRAPAPDANAEGAQIISSGHLAAARKIKLKYGVYKKP